MGWYGNWAPYVPVARRLANANAYVKELAKKERRAAAPVQSKLRGISASFWGRAWCDNLESYSDFSNRLPRGRTYLRNGSVVDLQIESGAVRAVVAGSHVYQVEIDIATLARAKWSHIKKDCSQSIGSLIDLLQGRFDQGVMQRLTERDRGLFPSPKEIEITCSCPDWAYVCKHVAACLYGVAVRLDTQPELLFLLRKVDHMELVSQAVESENLDRTLQGRKNGALTGQDLGELFGIEIEGESAPPKQAPTRRRQRTAKSSGVTQKKAAQPRKAKKKTAKKVAAVAPKKRAAKKKTSKPAPARKKAKRTTK